MSPRDPHKPTRSRSTAQLRLKSACVLQKHTTPRRVFTSFSHVVERKTFSAPRDGGQRLLAVLFPQVSCVEKNAGGTLLQHGPAVKEKFLGAGPRRAPAPAVQLKLVRFEYLQVIIWSSCAFLRSAAQAQGMLFFQFQRTRPEDNRLHSVLPFALGERVGKVYRNGTYRICSPADTLQRVRPHFDAMGITRVANVTGLDHIGIPVVMVCRPNSRGLSVSQGKGLGLEDAKASGVMEAIEFFHAEHIELPLTFESYAGLRRHARVADVAALPQGHDSRFRPNLRVFWIEGYDLLNEEPVWVPYELVHTDFRLPRMAGANCFLRSANGLASGNHRVEALIHGICEVIERDAVALWDVNAREQRQATAVRLETVDDPACRRVLETYSEAGIAVAVWNATSDIGVPTFLCHILEFDDVFRRLYAAGGCGCHPSRNTALLRALLEAAQSRLTVIVGARDDIPRSEYLRYRSARILKYFRSQMQPPDPGIGFDEIPTFDGATLNEDLDCLLRCLRRADIRQVIAVDLSKPDLGIPVVRTVIPFLEGPSDLSKYSPGQRAKAKLAKAR
jgi:YcaO-like protein with predicted kinase domain